MDTGPESRGRAYIGSVQIWRLVPLSRPQYYWQPEANIETGHGEGAG